MNIGAEIKKVRRQKEMTQEQLAEYLNVSVSAVSQWESNKTTPDISVIPTICNVLGITADELLGIDIAKKEANIEKLIDEISEISRGGNKKEAYIRYKEALRQYPDSYDLMYHVASEYIWLQYEPYYSAEEQKNMRQESIALLEKILEGCLDENIRIFAVSDLCGFYAQNGDIEKAEKLAEKLPNIANSRSFVLAGIYSGSKGIQSNKNLIFILLEFFSNRMTRNYKYDSGELLYSEEEILRLYEKQIELLNLIFDDGNLGFFNDDMQNAYLHVARYCASHGNYEEALSKLKLAADCAIAFIEYEKCDDYSYNSGILKGLSESPANGIWHSNTDNSAGELLNDMQSPEFDVIRNNTRFLEIENMLKKYKGSNN